MSQPYFCLEHGAKLLDLAPSALGKKEGAEFVRVVGEIMKNYLAEISEDVSAFCKSFDYRSSGKPLNAAQKNARDRVFQRIYGENRRGRTEITK